MTDDGLLFSCDTQYGHYSAADTFYNGRRARILYSGNQDAAQSGMALDDAPELLFDYNQRFLEIAWGMLPRSVLILGGGALTLPTALIREFPDIDIDVVERDGELVDIARRYFNFMPNKHTRVWVADGRQFLDEITTTYDLIIVDVFAHTVIPESFQTVDTAQCLQKCLNPDGVVAFNVIASLAGMRSAVLYRLYEVLRAVFSEVRVYPATRGLASWTPQNFVISAQDGSHDIAAYLSRAPVDSLLPDDAQNRS